MPLYYSDNNKSDGQSKSAKAVIEGKSNRHADRCYKVRDKNFGKGSYSDGIPHYALSFLLEAIRKKTGATLRVGMPKL